MGLKLVASIVQRLECKPSKLEMRVRFPLLAPRIFTEAQARAENSVSTEVLTKADERKAVAVKDTVAQPQQLKLAVVVEGSGRERVHVLPEERDIPATLRFSITGLAGADLKQIKNITVKRKGKVIKVFSDDEITTNSFKLPIRLKQNRIAHFEIVARLSNGKKIKAKKVYETYCYFDNYEDGKKSNRIYDMSAEEEYKNVVQKQLLKNE